MSGTHGVFQHRSGYFYTILEEDFCDMYKADGVNEVCRAYITSILENLTNKQFDEDGNDKDIWVYISLPEMARRMRNAYSERTIHKEIQGMIKDGFLKKRRSTGKATMEYCLNIKKIREGLLALPDKQSCRIARSNLAELQDQSGKFARSILQNCNNDLAELQPRVSKRTTIEETGENEGTNANESTQSDSPIPSSTPSLSVEQPSSHIATVDTGNASTPRNTEPLVSDARRVFGLLCEVFFAIPPEFTAKIEKQCALLAPHVCDAEDMKSLRDYTRVKVKNDPNSPDKQIHLGNLVKCANGWKQEQEPLPDKPTPTGKTKVKITPEYLASLPL